MLELLHAFYQRVQDELVPPGYRSRDIDWTIQLDSDGAFQGFVSTEGDEGPLNAPVPYRRRSGSTPPPYLLVDTPAYVLGLGLDKIAEDKAGERRARFVELLRDCAQATGSEAVKAVLRFEENGLSDALQAVPDGLHAGDLIGFLVDGVRTWDLAEVRSFWREKMAAYAATKSNFAAECIVCGKRKPIANRHPVELRVGPDRAQLITANKKAFESYGLEASEVAPVCYSCAMIYGRALGYLLDSDIHRLRTGPATYVFWTREPTDFNPWSLLEDPQPEDVRRLLSAPWRGRQSESVGAADFYALSVTSNQSRLVVRSWIKSTVQQVKRNIAAYFEAQRMVGPDGNDSPHRLIALAGTIVRDLNDIPPPVVPALVELALTGRPLPLWLLQKAVQRARADTDNRMTRPRAALIRMVFESHRRSNSLQEGYIVTAQLDLDNTSPAYLSGRLLAILEEVQRAALPRITSTLVDKYFGTACSAPATVFGTLMRHAQSHLGKLRKTNERAYHALRARLQDVAAAMPSAGFPRTLTLQDQALFSLGYYQQQAADRAAAREAAEAKRQNSH